MLVMSARTQTIMYAPRLQEQNVNDEAPMVAARIGYLSQCLLYLDVNDNGRIDLEARCCSLCCCACL